MDVRETLFDVFFSYQSRDHAPVEKVARVLTERGLRVFLDRWYLTPGLPWPQELERTLGQCQAFAVFLGTDGLGPWQQRERDLALDRQGRDPGFPVIPVLLTRANPALGFLALNTWVDLSENVTDDAALEILCAAIRGQPPGPLAVQRSAAVRAEVCPYRGLQIFREEDAAFFCGREAFTDKLAEMVERTPLVAVVGASGSGKSSVVRAGLIPRLRQSKPGRVWELATLVPTDRPLHSLAAALVPILAPEMTRIDRLAEVSKLARLLADGAVALRDVVADVLRLQPGTDRLLLFLDQWEELYTLVADDAARQRFVAEILDASAKGAMTAVLALRGDFFGQALSDRTLADRLQDAQLNLGPMTEDELRRSIVEPAERVDLRFEPGLVDRILEDVGQEPGNLPLLEFVLAQLWEEREGGQLQHAAYERMGGIQGAIAAHADAELAKLDVAQQEAARRCLVQMVRPGETSEDTRQRAPLPTGDAVALAAIRRLTDARLLVTARDPATGVETVEVAHEALIHNWSLLHGWVDADRAFLCTKTRLESEAALWEADQRDPSRLLPAGRPLAEGEAILASRRADLRASAVAYIEASAVAARRRRRRQVALRTAMAAAGLLALIGGGVYWDLYFREHRAYFNAFAKRWGVVEGVGPVSSETAKGRSRTLLFTREGRLGPVTRVDAVDGSGACARGGLTDPNSGVAGALRLFADEPTRLCSFVWERDSEGRVSKQTMLDAEGRAVASLVFTGEHRAKLFGPEGLDMPLGAATTITYERISDGGPNRGQDRFERYTDAAGKPAPFMGTGTFAGRLDYDPMGLPVRILFLGADDQPARHAAGLAEMRFRYAQSGSPVEISLFDEHGHPVRVASGYARRTMAYDGLGNQVEESYFAEDGRPTLIEKSHARLTLAYDERGREVESAYFDQSGQPTLGKDGYARIVRALDRQGRPVEEAYFDEAGKPALANDGYAKVKRIYDPADNAVESAYFDADGKPTRDKERGVARVARRYDDRGRLIEKAYFDPAGRPTRSKEGYHRATLQYDALGNPPIEEAYFDASNAPTPSENGYARVTKRYDVAGQLVEEAYFDAAGRPTLSKEGYARVTKGYNEAGRHVREAYFDEAGKPTLAKVGYASVLFEHDARGNMIRRSYYDAAGTPTRSKNKYSILTQSYDRRGKVVEEAFFDESGKPCLDETGVAKGLFWYDERGNKVKQAHFDETGKPTRSKEGVVEMISKYDARGNMVEQAYFDEAGKPVRSIHGLAKMSKVFDSRDRAVEESYFDEQGRPTRIASEGKAKILLTYDARGNQIESRYLDEESRPMRSASGYARVTQTFDDRDRLTEQAYFDEAGKPVRSKDGYARLTKAYDERGNVIEQAYFDETGRPVQSKDSYAKATMAYDARGNTVEHAYFDAAGRPTRSQDGYSVSRTTFDARGNAIEGAYFDEAGHPTPGPGGAIRWRAEHDERRNIVKARSFDEHGRPARVTEGHASFTKAYDSRGNRIAEAYFDEDGRPLKSKDGYARVTQRYDARDNEIEVAYFDEKGVPTRSKDGYAKVSKTYDSRGELVEQRYFDEQGMPIPGPLGPTGGSSPGEAAP